MKYSDITQKLFESSNRKLVLVDFQPEYSKTGEYENAFNNVIKYLIRYKPNNVIAFYNGDDFTADSEDEVRNHYYEYALESGEMNDDEMADFEDYLFHEIRWIDKGYAYLRGFMDGGIPESEIIKILRYMAIKKINNSSDISKDIMIDLVGKDFFKHNEEILTDEVIYFPTNVSISTLKTFSGSLIGGGSEHECLKELRILMSVFNIKSTLVKSWIY